ELDLLTADGEVFKTAAVHGDVAFGRVGAMLGIKAADDTIGGKDVHHVEAFDDGSNQSVVGVVVFLIATGNVGVGAIDGNKAATLKVFYQRAPVAASGRESGSGECVNVFGKGPGELSAQGVTTAVEMEMGARSSLTRCGGFCG